MTRPAPPIERFWHDEAAALKPLAGPPSFGQPRDLRRVRAGCAIDLDTNGYSVPWRLIGESVSVTVVGGRVDIRHVGGVVADHRQCYGHRQWIAGFAHLVSVTGAASAVRGAAQLPLAPPAPALLRPLAEYALAAAKAFDDARP